MEIQPRDPSHNHFWVSMIKSGFRLAAAAALSFGFFAQAGVLFGFAEFLGIVEELV